jgi:hypothetical protein
MKFVVPFAFRLSPFPSLPRQGCAGPPMSLVGEWGAFDCRGMLLMLSLK